MSAYQSNGKVKPPTNVASSTTSIKIAEKAPPAPCSRMGATKRGHADYVGCSCLRQRAFRREPECERRSLGAMRQRAEAGQGAAPGREYTETKIIKRQRRLSKCGISRRLRDISQEYKRRRFDNEKIGAPTDFFCYHRKAEKIRKCTSSYTQKYMRAVLPVIQKTRQSIASTI